MVSKTCDIWHLTGIVPGLEIKDFEDFKVFGCLNLGESLSVNGLEAFKVVCYENG